MKVLVQRVKSAKVEVKHTGELLGQIGAGLLLFVAIEKTDTKENLEKMCDKILHFRIFADSQGKLNLDINQTQKEILLVSQFTLAADTKGRRPGFSNAANADFAEKMFADFVKMLKEAHQKIQTGKFAENMLVSSINDGPLTFNLNN